ncbi:MAG TPA: NAD(P)/FAD-dependent oxidoreductase [Gemmatimonadaceae bacterium]
MASVVRIGTDVAVVGAGPAGSVIATRLLQLGFDVALIERARFPRQRLGESLSPGVMPLLAAAGVATRIEALRFPRVRKVAIRWEGASEVREDPREQGMLVDRGTFDAALVARARDIGVRVLQPADVRQLVAEPDGWCLTIGASDRAVELHSAFLVDATGRSGLVREPRNQAGPRTIAVHGYWTGSDLPRFPRIEAGESEWYWGVPIPGGSYNTIVFVDGERLRGERGASLDDRLRALLARASLADDVRNATLRSPARAADATPYYMEGCVGDRRISIGDAALALDPLSSSGVQKAIQTSLSGAIVVNTLLRRPDSRDAATRFYRNTIRESSERHQAWARRHYATAAVTRPHAFWTDRAQGVSRLDGEDTVTTAPQGDDTPLGLSAASAWEDVPCLGEQFVEIRTALHHPALEGPVAFVGGHALAPLLRDAPAGISARQFAAAWSDRMPAQTAVSIVHWLSRHGVLERCDSSSGTAV